MSEWQMRATGRSRDRRTNVWSVTPACGHKPFSPPTTMLSWQVVECPKCGLKAAADYNEETILPWDTDSERGQGDE